MFVDLYSRVSLVLLYTVSCASGNVFIYRNHELIEVV